MFFDIARITANNGWAMALTGATLVMLGLATLSLIISQLHKIIAFFEKSSSTPNAMEGKVGPGAAANFGTDCLTDPEVTAKLYQALTADLGDSFELAKLYQLAQKDQLPHPHLTLRTLREAGILIPSGQGTFSWKTT